MQTAARNVSGFERVAGTVRAAARHHICARPGNRGRLGYALVSPMKLLRFECGSLLFHSGASSPPLRPGRDDGCRNTIIRHLRPHHVPRLPRPPEELPVFAISIDTITRLAAVRPDLLEEEIIVVLQGRDVRHGAAYSVPAASGNWSNSDVPLEFMEGVECGPPIPA